MPRTAKNKKAVPVRWVSKDEFSAMVDSRAKRACARRLRAARQFAF